MKDKKITAELINKAVKLLRECGVKEPYYVEVENPKEGGDLLFKRVTNKKGKLCLSKTKII